MTQNENTLRINGTAAPGVDENGKPAANGVGQIGEGGTWFAGCAAVPAIKSSLHVVHSDAVFDYILGDATTAYPASAGLALYQRNLIFLKQMDAVIVIDTIQMKPGMTAQTLDLDFHPASNLLETGPEPGYPRPERRRVYRISTRTHISFSIIIPSFLQMPGCTTQHILHSASSGWGWRHGTMQWRSPGEPAPFHLHR